MENPARHRQPWTDEDLAIAEELMREGRSNREIAALIGRTEGTTNVAFYRLQLNRGLSHCLNCGTPLEQPKVGRKRRFCTEACRTADERERRRSEREGSVDPDRRCPYCDKAIPEERQLRGGKTVMYCSRICSQDAWYERKCAAQGKVPVKKPRQDGEATSTRSLENSTT